MNFRAMASLLRGLSASFIVAAAMAGVTMAATSAASSEGVAYRLDDQWLGYDA